MGSGSATLEMVTHAKAILALLLLGVTVVDIRGQSVVFPSNTDDAIVIEPAHQRKVPSSSLPVRWKRLNRLKNMWSERESNRTNVMGKVKPMDNEVEWGTEIFQTMKDGNLCGLVRTVQTVECLGSQLPGERESCGVLP